MSSTPKKRSIAEGTDFYQFSTLTFSDVSAQGFDLVGNGSVKMVLLYFRFGVLNVRRLQLASGLNS